MNKQTKYPSNTVTLDKIKLYAYKYFSEAFDDSVSVEIFYKPIFDQWKMLLVRQALAEKVWEYPATWWDAFKDRWFPNWLKDRYPVEYIHISAVYPELLKRVSLPKEPFYLVDDRREI